MDSTVNLSRRRKADRGVFLPQLNITLRTISVYGVVPAQGMPSRNQGALGTGFQACAIVLSLV
jgi:hypothetical protein